MYIYTYIHTHIYTYVFPIKVGCRSFIANSTSVFLTNLGLLSSDKWKGSKIRLELHQHGPGNPIE